MLQARTIKGWFWFHKWTSLICTIFLLLLAVTGLPLIFHDEIDHALGNVIDPVAPAPNASPASLDHLIQVGKTARPGEVVQFLSWDDDEPGTVMLSMGKSPTAPADGNHLVIVDAYTGQLLSAPAHGLVYVLLQLHSDMFFGPRGKLFLGLMGALFVGSIVSGIILYGPFMRRLEFGTIRRNRSRQLTWRDLHNLSGIVIAAWTLVVGATGIINTCDDIIRNTWRSNQLSAVIAPYKDQAVPAKTVAVDRAVAVAERTIPSMKPWFVAFPGSILSSNRHFAVFMRGKSPLSSKLTTPVFVDAVAGTVSGKYPMPWYVNALLISQPLHFGDYGGLPLKVIWALLDGALIVVLGSGIYLFFGKGRGTLETLLQEIEQKPDGSQSPSAIEPSVEISIPPDQGRGATA